MSKDQEMVLVVERESAMGIMTQVGNKALDLYPEGLIQSLPFLPLKGITPDQSAPSYFATRKDVEEDPKYIQIIPYVMVESGDGQVVVGRRLKQGGEARLHNQLTIGFGGHVNPVDMAEKTGLENNSWRHLAIRCAFRELQEELNILPLEDYSNATVKPHPCQEIELVGLLWSTDTPVDSVHLGVVMRWTCPVQFRHWASPLYNSKYVQREDNKMEASVVDFRLSVPRDITLYESWSQKLIVYQLMAKASHILV